MTRDPHAVLISYRMPAWRCWGLRLGMAGALAGILVCFVSNRAPAVLFLAVLPWFVRGMLTATSVVAAGDGLQISIVLGPTFRAAWKDVRQLRRGLARSVVLRIGQTRLPLFVSLPQEQMERLIALLRETSNARIQGF